MKYIVSGLLASLLMIGCSTYPLPGQSASDSYSAFDIRSQTPRLHNVELTGSLNEVIRRAFQLYGVDVVFAEPLQGLNRQVQVDLRNADLATTSEVLNAMTHCFFVPLNAHLVLAVHEDKEHRQQYEHLVTKTIDIPNVPPGEASHADIIGLLSNIFGIAGATVKGNTVTIHTTRKEAIEVENALTHLYLPSYQVLLNVKAYLVTHGRNHNVGVQPPQKITVFNVDSEVESLINSNSSVVQQLIAEGVVSASNTLGIAEALIAGGYGGNSVLNSPFVTFGGGTTLTGVQFGSVQASLDLNMSSSQQIREATLHLADKQSGTFKVGERYPVMTASTTALGGSSKDATPSIQYEDLGLTLETTPHIGSGGEVTLHIHETFRALNGASLNGIPALDNQEFIADLSVPPGATTVVVSNLSQTATRTAQGFVNFFPIDNAKNKEMSDLIITITPLLTRASTRLR